MAVEHFKYGVLFLSNVWLWAFDSVLFHLCFRALETEDRTIAQVLEMIARLVHVVIHVFTPTFVAQNLTLRFAFCWQVFECVCVNQLLQINLHRFRAIDVLLGLL